ncbi:hypothetical protein [Xenorhabdus sp. KJ12.1]|uniref:gp53-like domain-containing protein n=1 Tax=Xenorhabdus sp. KJ12.1 TaxID=1851571 RepID=UPI000C05E3BC|nr:hypothetical protein [Xenorhabdus sp. KJ12.1]PHM72685.1 NgrE [Xenorhabdus sp. KJ12.1]
MIYSQGTLSTVSGSARVRGTGTQWKSNINGIAAGQIISIRTDNAIVQNVIQSVNSDTELILAFEISVTLNQTRYVISTTVPDTVSDGVRHMAAINSYITQFLQNMDKWMSQNGVVNMILPNGQTVSLQSIRALQAAMEGKLDKSRNGADIPDKPGFMGNLGFTGSLRTPGYAVIPLNNRKLVIQWGTAAIPIAGSITVSYPLSVGQKFAQFVSSMDTGSVNNYRVSIADSTNNTLTLTSTNAHNITGVMWLAIGEVV